MTPQLDAQGKILNSRGEVPAIMLMNPDYFTYRKAKEKGCKSSGK